MKKKLKIFTWNVHGGYLNALVKTGHDFYIPVKKGRPYNYDGKTPGYIWPKNAHEIKVNEIGKYKYNLIIFQTKQHLIDEQFKIFTKEQLNLPKIFIFHTSPSIKRVNKKIIKKLNRVSVFIQITNYNLKAWSRIIPIIKNRSRVIYHGVDIDKKIKFSGELVKSITIINDLITRPECGPEIWKKITKKVSNDLYGSNSKKIGGKGIIQNYQLRERAAKYRVYFNPTTNNSLPMTLLEAMSAGLPVVSMATTEMPSFIQNGVNGFVSNNINILIDKLNLLINNRNLAEKMGKNAQDTIRKEFSIKKFIKEWNNIFMKVVD